MTAAEIAPWLILEAVVGSRAYGLANAGSDTDRRGVYLPPAERTWSLTPPPEQVEAIRDGDDFAAWELARFLRFALKGQPTVLEVLWSPLVTRQSAVGAELIALRGAFVSKAALTPYIGYAEAQLKLTRKANKPKPAVHLIRLLHAGLHLCRTGEVLVAVGPHLTELAAIRSGETPLDAVEERAAGLIAELRAAAETCGLPDAPDAGRVEAFLQRARRGMVGSEA